METFKELSLEEMQEIEGGNMGSDFLASAGYYAHQVWCDMKKAMYENKKVNDMNTDESIWFFM